MRFRTGFVVGCAAGYYLTQKARQLRAPVSGRTSTGSVTDSDAGKIVSLSDLARERAGDLLHSQIGNLARERVIALFENASAIQRSETISRN
ncbi:MAG: hypothetical protein ABR925_04770 [Acidimicrobiales bacterium]|jgi:hypothetical protein